MELPEDLARRYAAMALANIAREYPTKLDHFINDPHDVALPSALHPVFWGSFDWHSCVHSHWMLARLLRLFPDAAFASDIRSHFATRFTEQPVIEQPDLKRNDAGFSRMRLIHDVQGFLEPDIELRVVRESRYEGRIHACE